MKVLRRKTVVYNMKITSLELDKAVCQSKTINSPTHRNLSNIKCQNTKSIAKHSTRHIKSIYPSLRSTTNQLSRNLSSRKWLPVNKSPMAKHGAKLKLSAKDKHTKPVNIKAWIPKSLLICRVSKLTTTRSRVVNSEDLLRYLTNGFTTTLEMRMEFWTI